MDLKLPFEFKTNLRIFMRRAGYAEFNDFNANKISYAKRLGTDFYPRFHVYINQKDGFDFLSLHLDQKKASYAGSRAHNGEYDGELVEREAPRDEESRNAQLLIRAGFVYKEMAGVYDFLPLGLRVLNKIINIIREEIDNLGGQEILLSALQNPEVWKKSD